MKTSLTLPARPVVPYGLRLTEQQHAALLAMAQQTGCAPSTLARACLARGLELIAHEHGAAA